MTIGAVKGLFKGVNDFGGAFDRLYPTLGGKKKSVEKILRFTLTSLCEEGNRPILRILSLSKLKPRVFFVSATVPSPKWKQTQQFLQFRFFFFSLSPLATVTSTVPRTAREHICGAGCKFYEAPGHKHGNEIHVRLTIITLET